MISTVFNLSHCDGSPESSTLVQDVLIACGSIGELLFKTLEWDSVCWKNTGDTYRSGDLFIEATVLPGGGGGATEDSCGELALPTVAVCTVLCKELAEFGLKSTVTRAGEALELALKIEELGVS